MADDSESAAKSMTTAAFDNARQSAQQATQEFTKLFSQLKMPGLPDVEALVAAQRKNFEAMTTANKVAMEGAQTVARRHMEIMQAAMTDMTETVKSLTSVESPQAQAAKQADLLKSAYEKAVANMHELSELMQKANGEAVSLLNKRFVEAIDEVKLLIDKPRPPVTNP
jgi:phasin family protein